MQIEKGCISLEIPDEIHVSRFWFIVAGLDKKGFAELVKHAERIQSRIDDETRREQALHPSATFP